MTNSEPRNAKDFRESSPSAFSSQVVMKCSVMIEYFNQIADACDLTDAERLALLDPDGKPPALTQATIERISDLFEVWKMVGTCIPDQRQAFAWMKKPNDNPLFGGEPPLKRLIQPGGVEAVLRLLKGQVNVW